MTLSRKKLPLDVANMIEDLLLKEKTEIKADEFEFLRARSDYLTVQEKIHVGLLRPIIKRKMSYR